MDNRKALQFRDDTNRFETMIEDNIRELCKSSKYRDIIGDVIIVFKDISTGVSDEKEEVYFYEDNKPVKTLSEISNIHRNLKTENRFRPLFYVYVLGKDEVIIPRKNELLSDIGKCIGDDLGKMFKKLVDRIQKENEN